MSIRPVRHISGTTPHLEGAGVSLQRVFGFGDPSLTDPFLMMDDFRNDRPENYVRGFPWHPHRGIETITYVLAGEVEHGDSLGNRGTLGAGDVQWMTAGSGLLHQEFHSHEAAKRGGVVSMAQLWVNLRKSDKSAAPRYQDIRASDIPNVTVPNGSGTVRVIAGSFEGASGPADTFTRMDVLDMRLKAGDRFTLTQQDGDTALVNVLSGRVKLNGTQEIAASRFVALSQEGTQFEIEALEDSLVLFLGGEPIEEPIAAYGPFVMNTQDEIRQAIMDFRAGKMGVL